MLQKYSFFILSVYEKPFKFISISFFINQKLQKLLPKQKKESIFADALEAIPGLSGFDSG